MLLFLTKVLGRFLALCPEFLLNAFAWTLGNLLYFIYGSRRKMMLRNITLSFPERSPAWCRRVGRLSCIRIIETGLISIASPFFSDARILKMGGVSESMGRYFDSYGERPRPIVFGTVHFSYWEVLTWIPLYLKPRKLPEFLTVFRPLRNVKLDEWLRATRERFGVKLMSRRGGLHAALHVLQRNGSVAILFDQSAGSHGYLTQFLGRECSTTPLPGLLVEKTKADLNFIFARRTAFWRFTIEMIEVRAEPTPESVTVALNRALEKVMREDADICASWLWMHKRWRILDRPEERQKIIERRGGSIG